MCITGHIYKIVHLDSNLTYIGSTCDSISGRWRTHKNGYKNWLSNKEKFSTIAIYPYFERYGIDRFKMILIKSYEVYDKHHLRVYEQLAINQTKCVNRQAAMQLLSDNCMSKHYNILRSEQRKEQRKEYRMNNKEKAKHYYQSNKDKISTRVSAKIQCECGATSRKDNLSKHKKTVKHIAALAALST